MFSANSDPFLPLPPLLLLGLGTLPFFAVLLTSFAKTVIVLGLLRQALGMSMVSPTLISVPFKLLLFVALDGWARLAQGLVLTYQ
jgi:type III secretion protein R